MLRRLRRIFSWDAKNGRTPGRGEDARAESAREANISGRSSGTDTNYSQRFTH